MFVSFWRIIKYAFRDFFRNFWLSFVTLTILFLALASVNLLIILNSLAERAITSVEDKVDVTVYFKSEIKEEQVQNVQNYLSSLEGVKGVDFISRDQALINFRSKHKSDPKILETLDELKDNPLGATLVIHANNTEDYQKILTSLETDQYKNLIEDKDFEDHRLVIERLGKITSRVSSAVVVVAIIFALISILIVFNAIRVAIYTHRDEIRVMKLVGATNAFIIAPYILEGLLYAFFAVLITVIVAYPLLGILQPYLSTFFENGDVNIVQYFNNNFALIFGLQFAGAAVINILSALIATGKYTRG